MSRNWTGIASVSRYVNFLLYNISGGLWTALGVRWRVGFVEPEARLAAPSPSTQLRTVLSRSSVWCDAAWVGLAFAKQTLHVKQAHTRAHTPQCTMMTWGASYESGLTAIFRGGGTLQASCLTRSFQTPPLPPPPEGAEPTSEADKTSSSFSSSQAIYRHQPAAALFFSCPRKFFLSAWSEERSWFPVAYKLNSFSCLADILVIDSIHQISPLGPKLSFPPTLALFKQRIFRIMQVNYCVQWCYSRDHHMSSSFP